MFLIKLVLVSFLGYNIVGIYYNFSRHGRQGLECVPHIDRWRKVPGQLGLVAYLVA